MSSNYDLIAEEYKRAKQQPWRAHIEVFTLMRLIGDPTAKSVIDIACGVGFYTRMIASGARRKSSRTPVKECLPPAPLFSTVFQDLQWPAFS